MTFLRRLLRRLLGPSPAAAEAAFSARGPELAAEFLAAAGRLGRPRGLDWVSADPAGPAVVVADRRTGELLALLPVVVGFRPTPGSGLEDVPQARDPRPVTAVFAWRRGGWRATGRAVFNLSPGEVVGRSGGRFEPVSRRPRP